MGIIGRGWQKQNKKQTTTKDPMPAAKAGRGQKKLQTTDTNVL